MKKQFSFGVAGFGMLLVLALVLIPITAQQECTAFIQATLQSLEETCAAAEGGTACVASSTAIDGDAGSVSPATVVRLDNFNTIETVNDIANDALGLSILNVGANVPLSLSETGLRYVLVGDVLLENQVDVASAIEPVAAVPVTAIVGSNLRASPSTNGSIIDSVTPGTQLDAFGVNGDGSWLQVLYQGRGVWISNQVVAPDGDLSSLPDFTAGAQTLMQSFRLETQSATPDCVGQPPSLLLVQGPADFGAEITVNGVDIRLQGTIALQTITDEAGITRLRLSTLSGGAQSNAISLPTGFTMSIQLDEDGMVGDATWETVAPMTGDQLAFFSPLAALPATLFFDEIAIPTQGQIAQTLASLNTGAIGQGQAAAGSSLACGGLVVTSPIATMPNNPQTPFFWDGVPGATGYRLTIFDGGGGVATSVDTSALSTTLLVNTTPAGIGDGSNFGWRIEALVDGRVACTSGTANVLREANIQPIGGAAGGDANATPTACPWASC